VQGYSALQPAGVFRYPRGAPPLAPAWRSDLRISDSGISFTAPSEKTGPHSRFRRANDGGPADISIRNETFNTLTLDLSGHGTSEPLIRTDTHYPGWHAAPDKPLEKFEPCFSKIAPMANIAESLTLRYTPAMSRFYGYMVGAGLLSFTVLLLAPLACRRKMDADGAAVPCA